MQSDQPGVEEVTFEDIERELQIPQRPKHKKKIPFAVWLELQAPKDLKTPDENIEQQDSSLTTTRAQETNNTAEKEQLSMSEEQPPKTRRNKKKKIPFQVWMEKHAPADLRTSAEGGTGKEDDSPVTEKVPISGLQETINIAQKSFKSCGENVNKQDISPPEEGNLEDSLKEICKEEPIISTKQLVTENKSMSKPQQRKDQKVEKQISKTKRIKKPLLWKSFPESDASIDLTFFTENSSQAALPSRKKSFWKVLPKSEPHMDISFIAENTETQKVSKPAQEQNQTSENVKGECLREIQNLPHSSEKTSHGKCTCEAKFKASELEYIKVQKYLMRQLDELFDINRKLSAKLRQQKELTRKGLSERNQSKTSVVSVQIQEDSQDCSWQKTVHTRSGSVQIARDIRETSYQLKPHCRTISTQTEIDVQKTKCQLKPVSRTTSTQTEMDVLESKCQVKPVSRTTSTQTEMDVLESKCQVKPVSRTTSTQTEMDVLETGYPFPVHGMIELETNCKEKLSESNGEEQHISAPETVGDQTGTIENEIHAKETVIVKEQQITEEKNISENQPNGDEQDNKKPSRKAKWRTKRKAAMKAASDLENPNKDNVSGQNCEKEASVPETGEDQTATVKNTQMIETTICSPQQISEEDMISERQQNGVNEMKKQSKKYKNKKKRKAALKAASEREATNNDQVFGENMEEEVSIPEIVKDQGATIIIEICENKTVIDKPTEDEMGIQQNGDQQDETNIETPKTDFEIPQTVCEKIVTNLCTTSEDVTSKVHSVSTEGENGLTEEQRTSPPQMKVTLKEDIIQTTPEESELQGAEESAEQKNMSEQEERPRKNISLWRRIKKALTPTCLRQFKDRR